MLFSNKAYVNRIFLAIFVKYTNFFHIRLTRNPYLVYCVKRTLWLSCNVSLEQLIVLTLSNLIFNVIKAKKLENLFLISYIVGTFIYISQLTHTIYKTIIYSLIKVAIKR